MQTQRQSVTGTRSIIATLDEARSATQQVAFAARRLLTMYTQDLEPAVYDQPQFLETVKKLVLAKSYAKVRVLLADPSRVVYEGSKFVHLARRITTPLRLVAEGAGVSSISREDGLLVVRFGAALSRATAMNLLGDGGLPGVRPGDMTFASNQVRIRVPASAARAWELTQAVVARLAAPH